MARGAYVGEGRAALEEHARRRSDGEQGSHSGKDRQTLPTRETLARSGLRRLNRSLILKHLVREGPLSRTQLGRLTGLTSGAVSRITGELIAAGILQEGDSHSRKGKAGPPFVALNLAPRGGYVLGLGLEASAQEVGIADLRGSLLARQSLRLRRLADPRTVAAAVAEAAWRLVSDAHVPAQRIFALGAAVIGIVDPARGLVLESPYLKWNNAPFAEDLRLATGLPVFIDGLLHALNLAEANHGPREARTNVIYVHTTLGLGASILTDGVLLRGKARAAGQIGHIRVAAPADRKTPSSAPLASLSSGRAILRALGLSPHDVGERPDFAADLKALKRVLRKGLEPSTPEAGVIRVAGEHLGEYLGGLCGVLNPERISLGGLLGRHPRYVDGVAEGISHQTLVPQNYRPELTVSDMDSTLAGALLALNSAVLTGGFDLPPFDRVGALADIGD